ncbi:N-acetyltransferase [Vibrio cholerae]|uniref:acyltransferase n=1 Tax=Vibrio TaxID=662 RepID=UPI0005118C27|nr:acyltransferase [Vibrio cholerae]ELB7342689.1 N-acetyltransferase [Vibrio cholerae]ELC9568485.1 N-acetyltransferase [Vibrio cholerae]ELK8283870.1 N-acetyltransferase [Vibrio cholerae]KUO31710.1 UDP-3-O-(3-hydroxymyristoyl)glucosamine N-acyltransferase [Vibrio cholerae]MCX9535967.1 N-acetyltransferase [Vibrio cholerae]
MTSPRVLKAQIKDVICGENVTVIEPSNIYGCELKDGVFIGPFVEIQKNSVIGARTKIQSHTFICEYVTIGTDCFVGHGVMFANDLFKNGQPDPNPDNWGRTVIANNVTIGSNATVLPVSICDGVVIGAGSVVTKNITEKGIYAGNPAKKLRDLP